MFAVVGFLLIFAVPILLILVGARPLGAPLWRRMPAPLHIEYGEPLYRYCEEHKHWYSVKTGKRVELTQMNFSEFMERYGKCRGHE